MKLLIYLKKIDFYLKKAPYFIYFFIIFLFTFLVNIFFAYLAYFFLGKEKFIMRYQNFIFDRNFISQIKDLPLSVFYYIITVPFFISLFFAFFVEIYLFFKDNIKKQLKNFSFFSLGFIIAFLISKNFLVLGPIFLGMFFYLYSRKNNKLAFLTTFLTYAFLNILLFLIN